MVEDISMPEENKGESKTKKSNNNGLLISIAIFVVITLLCILAVHLTTTISVREETTKRYEIRIENLKKNHQREVQDTIEIYERAIKDHKRQSDHSQKLAELARKQDVDIRFQMALTNAIIKLQPKLDRKTADRISSEIVFECKEKNLDPILVAALIWVESRFDVMAHSKKGAVGLMQVRYSTWKETPVLKDNGVSAKYKLYWIDLNIKCGTEILAKYYEEAEGSITRTLYRYNTGSSTIPEDKDVIEINYINKIMLTAYWISDSIRKGKNDSLENH